MNRFRIVKNKIGKYKIQEAKYIVKKRFFRSDVTIEQWNNSYTPSDWYDTEKEARMVLFYVKERERQKAAKILKDMHRCIDEASIDEIIYINVME